MKRCPKMESQKSASSTQLSITAHAKVNLMLHVTGREQSGYHTLQSVFAFTEFGDQITLNPASSLSIDFTGKFGKAIPSEEPNSMITAMRWYFRYFGLPYRFYKIKVTKNIPVAAGLGGGTSDAAAVLAFLFEEDFPDASEEEVRKFVGESSVLGADVPISLRFHLGHGTIFWLDGTGEKGTVWSLETQGLSSHMVLVNPGKPLPTASVFAKLAALGEPYDPEIACPKILTDDFLLRTHNTLQTPALQLVPELEKIFERREQGQGPMEHHFRLSGSGATCFVLCKDRQSAKRVVDKVRTIFPFEKSGLLEITRLIITPNQEINHVTINPHFQLS
jgi:4-diphosphocytidyl-2-C-methyl-D-erythritol kinase